MVEVESVCNESVFNEGDIVRRGLFFERVWSFELIESNFYVVLFLLKIGVGDVNVGVCEVNFEFIFGFVYDFVFGV